MQNLASTLALLASCVWMEEAKEIQSQIVRVSDNNMNISWLDLH